MSENVEVIVKVKKTDDMTNYMKNYMKKYTENKESVQCPCGGTYKTHQLCLHNKTKIHRRYLTHKRALDLYKEFETYEREVLTKIEELMDKMDETSNKLEVLSILKP